jgi:hypothetical protein
MHSVQSPRGCDCTSRAVAHFGDRLIRSTYVCHNSHMQKLVAALVIILAIANQAHGAGASRRPQGKPLTESEKRLFAECEKIARAQGYDSSAYMGRCRALRPNGARLFVERPDECRVAREETLNVV